VVCTVGLRFEGWTLGAKAAKKGGLRRPERPTDDRREVSGDAHPNGLEAANGREKTGNDTQKGDNRRARRQNICQICQREKGERTRVIRQGYGQDVQDQGERGQAGGARKIPSKEIDR
jgi:hypothetical protein